MTKENDNKPDFKEDIRKVLKDHKSKFQTEYDKDLAEYIPGLYRLLDLYKANDLDKIIISKGSLKKLCNDMVPFSFRSISDINYTKLNLISFRLIGCYGNYTLIAKLLLNKEIINEQIYDLLINKSSLRPGIYLLLVNPDLGLIIHWPEVGCYEENASSQRKKNMINLHRYLTKLTDHQLCLMSDKDLESFDWNLLDADSDEDDVCCNFEVKKSLDEQDFKASLGFKVNLSKKIKTEINNDIQDDIPLHPIVVESATNQSFVTRQLIMQFIHPAFIYMNQLQITIYETSLEQDDNFNIQQDEFYIPNPSLRQSGTSFNIDPQVYDFRKISQFDRKFLLVLWNKKMRRTEIFFDTAQKLAQNFQRPHSIKPFKVLNTDENYFIAVNEPRELIAILSTKKVALNIFTFNEGQANLCSRSSTIHLLQWYNGTVPNIQHFLFIKDTEDLCFVEKGGRARKFNLVNQQFWPAIYNLPQNTTNVLSSPDGSCIVAFVKEKISIDADDTDDGEQNSIKESDVKEACRAHVYFCANFGGPVSKVIELPSTIQYLEFLQFTCINRLQTHLVSLDLQNGCFNSIIVKITVEEITQYRFQERAQKKSLGLIKISQRNNNYTIIEGKDTCFEKHVLNEENIVIMGEKYSVLEVISNTKLKIAGDLNQTSGLDKWMGFRIEPKIKLNGLIDAYGLMFKKYPVENCIDPEQNRPLSLKIVLDVENEIEKYNEKFEEYIAEMFDDLKRSTKKPASILKKFSTSVVPFQEFDIENAKFQKKFSSEYKLGEWIIQLCCLIPIQIAVARNNLFQPLKDGLFSNEIDQTELDDGHHIDNIAKNISFGWYEGIFKHFGDKKVKVVSSMGEQSCGKSFMLNHLIGTTFDGFAMRCTEGVWMSLVNTKEYIYVALDFEALKSFERTPREDMFLTLFNTVVSNLILFKNQIVNRDMFAIFQRFQDGATLFETDSKIFQAKLCIIIRDVPKTDKDDVVREFSLRFSQLVSEGGEDNFISRMYKGGLDVIPWPMFNDTAWFKTLLNVKEKLNKQKAKYENAKTFLQNTKIIMSKLKVCDWRSLDESLIQIRVATLKRLLPTAVSYGLEQKDSDSIKQLMNCDSGELIGDPVVSLSNILHDFEDSTEILPDSDIQLRDEQESFEQLSEGLRLYFEDIVQPRKESSDDSKWFANLNRFFKYIIERRVSRIQDWYTQNIAEFPQDNSDIVNGKHATERELNELTFFWTLCGLTCHQCGLKCVKNRDHKEDHDCLTDHKCHFNCQFIEAHNSRLIPRCSHKAGHEGKHVCKKSSHFMREKVYDKDNYC